MELTQEVVSIELAKELQSVGLCLRSNFVWTNKGKLVGLPDNTGLRAYTAQELIVLLPQGLKIKIEGMRKSYDGLIHIGWTKQSSGSNQKWTVDYDRFQVDYNVEAETLPDAVAKMFLFLVKRRLITYPVKIGFKFHD
jgi:hypothetical protein